MKYIYSVCVAWVVCLIGCMSMACKHEFRARTMKKSSNKEPVIDFLNPYRNTENSKLSYSVRHHGKQIAFTSFYSFCFSLIINLPIFVDSATSWKNDYHLDIHLAAVTSMQLLPKRVFYVSKDFIFR